MKHITYSAYQLCLNSQSKYTIVDQSEFNDQLFNRNSWKKNVMVLTVVQNTFNQ